jgi:predicted transcriptional regulator
MSGDFKMSLKKLTIHFQEMDDLFQDINQAVGSKTSLVDSSDSINFDSLDTYRSFMTSNKTNILSAISKLKPGSVYELASFLNRQPQHVLADCRSLESHGFIKLIQEEVGRKALRPELAFDYDVIMVEGKGTMPLAVSEKSERVLAQAVG